MYATFSVNTLLICGFVPTTLTSALSSVAHDCSKQILMMRKKEGICIYTSLRTFETEEVSQPATNYLEQNICIM
jgi:hypothetical protein